MATIEIDRDHLDRGFWRWRDRVHWLVPGLLILLGIAVRAWGIARESLDPDEIWSYTAASLDWPGLLDMVARDISHPPLFYALVKLVLLAGGSDAWAVRLVSLAAGAVMLAAAWGLCEALRMRLRETALALFLIAANSYFIEYAQYLRMFGLLQAMSVVSLWLFVRALDPARPRGRAVAALTAANLVLVYSHYWGWFFVGIEGLWVLVAARRLLLSMILSTLVVVAGFAPWIWLVARAVHAHGAATDQIGWMERPELASVIFLVDRMNGSHGFPHAVTIGLALFGLPILAWLVVLAATRRGTQLAAALMLAAFWAITIGVTFFVSRVLDRPVWGARHLIIAGVPYLVLASLAASRLLPGRLGLVLPLLLALWSGGASIETLRETGARSFAWDDVLARIRTAEGAGTAPIPVFTDEIFLTLPARFYGQRLDGRALSVTEDPGLSHVAGDHFWVLYRAELWRGAQSPEDTLAAEGFHAGEGFTVRSRFQTLVAKPVDR